MLSAGTSIALAHGNKKFNLQMDKVIDQLFGVHAQSLSLRAKRSEMLAANIANVDTPNYKAKDLDFDAALKSFQGSSLDAGVKMNRSNQLHMSASNDGIGIGAIRYRVPSTASLDGNTVDADKEKSTFTENAMRYQISLTFLNRKISGMIKVLRGE